MPTELQDEQTNLQANEGLGQCDVEFVLVRSVLKGADLTVVHAAAQVHYVILHALGE